jgi:chorismate synthase
MSTYGKNIIINLFGESHGSAIGITINNLPAGIEIDLDDITFELSKRRPKSNLSTPRQEKDEFEFLSGYFKGKTTGSPLTVILRNADTRSRDYTPEILRPSHADYTSSVKYEGHHDYRGSGHFSGRITAPLMILGSISKQILAKNGITIASHIASIKDIKDTLFTENTLQKEVLSRLLLSDFPLLNELQEEPMKTTILNAKENKDSVGGVIETAILGISPGYGEPFFDSIESTLSHLIFSIPAVKGLSFGKGFEITTLFGSEANDSFILDNGLIKTKTNNSGGIQGGISNGMPITFSTAIKPTASIGKKQNTVNIQSMQEEVLELKGRHDPAIVHRVIHVINAITNYAILEVITRKEGTSWIK